MVALPFENAPRPLSNAVRSLLHRQRETERDRRVAGPVENSGPCLISSCRTPDWERFRFSRYNAAALHHALLLLTAAPTLCDQFSSRLGPQGAPAAADGRQRLENTPAGLPAWPDGSTSNAGAPPSWISNLCFLPQYKANSLLKTSLKALHTLTALPTWHPSSREPQK